ncbi:MAG: DNA gyrase subunit A [Firmicutes bacterium]|nr:DNA gyrase subunit A [Bacillota bacterium]
MAVDPGNIRVVNLEEEMKRAYIDYAMSVIVARALPDARDGLKPVQRRILYDMHAMGHAPDKPYVKSARVVGDVMGHYHPHGDAAIYDAMVKLVQPFNTRYPLVDGHGNFGSVDGDPPAAPRYTEVRQARIALEMLRDIDKKTVDFGPNFDQEEEEPLVLPARFPNLLANGSAGIAVGMATNIPPHNLREVADAVDRVLADPDVSDEELMAVVRGPDFPTGGLIIGREGIEQAYRTGRGSIVMRAVARIDSDGHHPRIVVTELPYQVNKARLVERIAELARERRIEGITDLRDESDREGLRIVIELRRDANARAVLRRLYRLTPMQDTFGVILLALVDNRPRLLSLKQALVVYADHQRAVVRRRTEYDLGQAEERAHILEGLLVALANLDEVIRLIRQSPDGEAARQGLMERFSLSEAQAKAILDLRLQRLTALEREKVEAEHRELVATIADLRAILADEGRVREIVRRELREVAEKFGDERRTRIVDVLGEDEEGEEDLEPSQDVVVTFTHFGYVKRQPLAAYRTQRRGGRGVTGARAREEDFVEHLFVTTTHHSLLVFTDRGRAYRLGVHRLPEAGRGARGTAIVNLLDLAGGEKVTAVIPLPPGEPPQDVDLMFVTRRGRVKRTALSEFANVRRNGLIAMGLEDGDGLVGVHLTREDEEVLLATRRGQLVRFVSSEVRRMGRSARGVSGASLRAGDEVVASAAGVRGGRVLTVTEAGMGKQTPLADYRRTARGAVGVRLIGLRADDAVAGILVLDGPRDVMLISSEGVLIRTPSAEIAEQSRGAHGVRVMRLGGDDRVSAIAAVPDEEGGEE